MHPLEKRVSELWAVAGREGLYSGWAESVGASAGFLSCGAVAGREELYSWMGGVCPGSLQGSEGV